MSYSAIELYYIDGISRENTPYFASVNDQASFFSTNKFATIDNSYYVPHYQDKIKIDTDDVSIFNKVNYLSITFGSKKFYYFIDSVEYISEDVIELSISLDSIQTFMFNVIFHDGIIEREHIDRWIYDSDTQEYSINRNYIQESLGTGNFRKAIYSYKPMTDIAMIVAPNVMDMTKHDSGGDSNVYPCSIYKIDYGNGEVRTYHDTSNIRAFPLTPTDNNIWDTLAVLKKDTSVTPNVYSETDYSFSSVLSVSNFASANIVYDFYYFPFNPFDEQAISYHNNKIFIIDGEDLNGNVQPFKAVHDIAYGTYGGNPVSYGISISPDYLIKYDNDNNVTFTPPVIRLSWKQNTNHYLHNPDNKEFSRNEAINEPYNSRFIISMIDENYINVNFGEENNFAHMMLYRCDKPVLTSWYLGDPISGHRYYGIKCIDVDNFTFSLNNMVDCEPISYTSRPVDEWRNWIERNKYTEQAEMIKFTGKLMLAVFGGMALKASMKVNPNASFKNAKFGKAFTESASGSSKVAIANSTRSASKLAFDASASGGMSELTRDIMLTNLTNSTVGYFSSMLNIKNTPLSPRTSGQMSGAYASGVSNPVYFLEFVDDFESIAYFYHRYGNLVQRKMEYSGDLDFYTQFRTRYYFNYIKFLDIDIDISMLCSEDMTMDLHSRLLEGVRLWDVSHGHLCDYRYDNVELAFLGGI